MLRAFSIRKWEQWVLFSKDRDIGQHQTHYVTWRGTDERAATPCKKIPIQKWDTNRTAVNASQLRQVWGGVLHFANLLSLQQGKVHNPSTSKMTSWMAITITEFYERVERIVNLTKTENGLYQNITSFWIPGIGEKGGQLLHLPCKTSAKTA